MSNYDCRISRLKSNISFKSPWFLLMLTVLWFVGYYCYLVVPCLLITVAIAVAIIVQITCLIVTLFKEGKLSIKQSTLTALVILFSVSVILNVWTIDFACTYAVTRVMEDRLLRKARYSPGLVNWFHRFYFGSFAGNERWLVYDESDQVLLPPDSRSKDWWRMTKENKEADITCVDKAIRIYSHFYIQYSDCK